MNSHNFHMPVTIPNARDPPWKLRNLSELMFGSDCTCQHFSRWSIYPGPFCLLSSTPASLIITNKTIENV